MNEEEKLYRKVKRRSVVISFIVVLLMLLFFINELSCTSSSCNIWCTLALIIISIPSALFLHPLFFVMACYKITGSLDESDRRDIKFYLMFTNFVVITFIMLLWFESLPMPFVVVSLISMLVWGVASFSIPICLLIKGLKSLKSSAYKEWLILSYFMPLIGLIKFRIIK